MNEPRSAQMAFAAELAQKTHALVYFPLYPKLPVSTALPCFALLNNYYLFLRKKSEVLLVGDSSGGALALSLAAARSEIGDVIAISPWVQLSLSEEGRAVMSDVMLSVESLDFAAKLWAEGLPFDDFRVSPIFGAFMGKRIYLTCGGYERFRPDIMRFRSVLSESGATVTYLEGAAQQHCYPLMPTPEGRAARNEIVRWLQKRLYGENE